MRTIIFASVMTLFSVTAHAEQIKCLTDTKKIISMGYSSKNNFVSYLTLEHADYARSAKLSITPSSVKVDINPFIDGKILSLTIQGKNSFYKLGHEKVRPMECVSFNNSGSGDGY